jgi:hypothetical protein
MLASAAHADKLPNSITPTSNDVLPNRWEYSARAATLWPKSGDPIWIDPKSGDPYVYSVSFRCQERPLFYVSGTYVAELTGDKTETGELSKERSLDFVVTTDDGSSIALKSSCANGEGSPICFIFPNKAQLSLMTGSASLTFSAKNQRLLRVPFGSVAKVRKIFPSCVGFEKQKTASPGAQVQKTSRTQSSSAGSPVGCEKVWAPRLREALEIKDKNSQEIRDLMKFGLMGYEFEPKQKKCARVRRQLAVATTIQQALKACPRIVPADLAQGSAARERFIAKGMGNQQCDQ